MPLKRLGGSTFRFNGKECDEETGNYYYGARYYDPKVSVWLSVDRLAAKYPHVSPYNFTLNNPINLINPNGDSVNVSGLMGHERQMKAFEAFAATPEGRKWILDRAEKGFSYTGVYNKDLKIEAKSEGMLSAKGIDVKIAATELDDYRPLVEQYDKFTAESAAGYTDVSEKNGRLKETFLIDDMGSQAPKHGDAVFYDLMTLTHEAMFHGDMAERNFIKTGTAGTASEIGGGHKAIDYYNSAYYKSGINLLLNANRNMGCGYSPSYIKRSVLLEFSQ